MADNNGNGKYGSDRANAAAAIFKPVDKDLAAVQKLYSEASTDDERDEIRSAVLDHLDPGRMTKDRIKNLQRAVGVVDEKEADLRAAEEWHRDNPVILQKPVNTRGAELVKQIAALEEKRSQGLRPYDDLGEYVTALRRLTAEQKSVNEEFESGPMADYNAQQARWAEFSKANRESRLRGSRSTYLVPDGGSEEDINASVAELNAADDERLMATPGVKEMREAQSPQELTRILAGIEGIQVQMRGEGV